MDAAAPSFLDVLVFEVAGWRFGLPSLAVEELVRIVTIRPLPKAPAVIEGLINLRGQLVPVFDIRRRFRLRVKGPETTDHLVVARAGTRVAALRVDRAVDLVRISGNAIEDVSGIVPGVEHVSGVAKLPDGLVLIHDVRTFLSEAESAALDESLSEFAESEKGSRASDGLD
jgi:purine-binding chemotaxis protein CheW